MELLERGLEALGFTPHEARVYFHLLRSENGAVREVIRATRLSHATAYRVLARLQLRGLVGTNHRWPGRYVALPLPRLFEWVKTQGERDTELLGAILETYRRALRPPADHENLRPSEEPGTQSEPSPPRIWGTLGGGSLLVLGSSTSSRFLVDEFRSARAEVEALVRPRFLPAGQRDELARAVSQAARRGVQIRLAVDHHPAEMNFLRRVYAHAAPVTAAVEVRFYTPQHTQLFLFDHRVAARFVGPLDASHRALALGISSSDAGFVRAQASYFRGVWGDATPVPLPGAHRAGRLRWRAEEATLPTRSTDPTSSSR